MLCAAVSWALQVEMAYDLLVKRGFAGPDSAMEEFADQCKIISEVRTRGLGADCEASSRPISSSDLTPVPTALSDGEFCA
jgi:hypothetical protein